MKGNTTTTRARNTAELRALLLDTIAEVKSENIGVKEANAVSSLTNRVIQTVKLDLQAAALSRKYGTGIGNSSTKLLA